MNDSNMKDVKDAEGTYRLYNRLLRNQCLIMEAIKYMARGMSSDLLLNTEEIESIAKDFDKEMDEFDQNTIAVSTQYEHRKG